MHQLAVIEGRRPRGRNPKCPTFKKLRPLHPLRRKYAQIETSKVFSKQHCVLFCLARTVSALYARTATKATVSLTVAARAAQRRDFACDVNYL